MPTIKKSGTKKFVNTLEPFLRLALVRRGLFAAVFVLRVVPRFCVVIFSFFSHTERGETQSFLMSYKS